MSVYDSGVFTDETERMKAHRGASAFDGLGVLLSRTVSDIGELLDLKLRLLRKETTATVAGYAKDGGMLIVGGALMLVSLLFIDLALLFLVAWLLPFSPAMNYALGAASVVLLNLGGGAALLWFGLKRASRRSPLPEKTIHEFRRDREWLSRELH